MGVSTTVLQFDGDSGRASEALAKLVADYARLTRQIKEATDAAAKGADVNVGKLGEQINQTGELAGKIKAVKAEMQLLASVSKDAGQAQSVRNLADAYKSAALSVANYAALRGKISKSDDIAERVQKIAQLAAKERDLQAALQRSAMLVATGVETSKSKMREEIASLVAVRQELNKFGGEAASARVGANRLLTAIQQGAYAAQDAMASYGSMGLSGVVRSVGDNAMFVASQFGAVGSIIGITALAGAQLWTSMNGGAE